jgi:hypothetical protein
MPLMSVGLIEAAQRELQDFGRVDAARRATLRRSALFNIVKACLLI